MIKNTQECLFCKTPTVFDVDINSVGETCNTCHVYYLTNKNDVYRLRFGLELNEETYCIFLYLDTNKCNVCKKSTRGTWKEINCFDFLPDITPTTAPKFLKRVVKLLSIS